MTSRPRLALVSLDFFRSSNENDLVITKIAGISTGDQEHYTFIIAQFPYYGAQLTVELMDNNIMANDSTTKALSSS